MKNTICLYCTTINQSGNSCKNCGESNSQFNDILIESKSVFRYGYQYRKYYEKQFQENNNINSKPSLISPETIPELLTAAALAGVIGNFTFEIFKLIAKKIITLIKSKEEKDKYRKIIELVTDDKELKLFFQYVSDYYWQRPLQNEIVSKAIEEEIMADFIGKSMSTKEVAQTFEMKDKEEASRLRLEIIKQAYKDWYNFKETKEIIKKERLNEILKNIEK